MPVIFDRVTGQVDPPPSPETAPSSEKDPPSELAVRQKILAAISAQQKRDARLKAD